jgi:outer membrane immunogenic protein
MAAGAAADGYEPEPAAAPLVPVIPDLPIWSGLYVNGGVGYGLWTADTTTDLPNGACVVCNNITHGGRGWLGEIGLGYDVQLNDKLLIGALFNYNFSAMSGTLDDSIGLFGKTNNDSTWFIGARGGWLMNPSVLNYVSVGYTQAHFDGGNLSSFVTLPGPVTRSSYDAGGWFIGGGLEVALRGGWFWRSEVRYSDYSKAALTETFNGAPAATLNFDPVVETATSELVYKFNWH